MYLYHCCVLMSDVAIVVLPAARRAPTPPWAAAAMATHQPRAKRAFYVLPLRSVKPTAPAGAILKTIPRGKAGVDRGAGSWRSNPLSGRRLLYA